VTAVRPEGRDADGQRPYSPYGQAPGYGGSFDAPAEPQGYAQAGYQNQEPTGYPAAPGYPEQQPYPASQQPHQAQQRHQGAQQPHQVPQTPHQGHQGPQQAQYGGGYPGYPQQPYQPAPASESVYDPYAGSGYAAPEPPPANSTQPMPVLDPADVPGSEVTEAAQQAETSADGEPQGRAARRRAAQQQSSSRHSSHSSRRRAASGGGRRRRGRGPGGVPVKESPGLIAVRVMGELFITFGVVMFLFVAYQLWWTNVRAHAYTAGTDSNLEKKWGSSSSASGQDSGGPFPQGQTFAIIYIPKLDVEAPIAEGTDKATILDKGEVGHYNGALETAFPWDSTGNFALAGHRNTHGEPFRYINKLAPGDQVIVETAHDYYTYKITSTLPQTDPSNVSVIQQIPPQSGFNKPGRYITLTTCTPEFTSTYRLIVWGVMTDIRPRSEGKPAALNGG
jgi:sortase A